MALRRARPPGPWPDTYRQTGRSRFSGPGGKGFAVCAGICPPPWSVALKQDEHLCPDVRMDEAMTHTNMRNYEIVLAQVVTYMMEDLEHVSRGTLAGLPVGNGATLEDVGCSAPRHGSGGA